MKPIKKRISSAAAFKNVKRIDTEDHSDLEQFFRFFEHVAYERIQN